MNGDNREYYNSRAQGPEQPPYGLYEDGVKTPKTWYEAIYAAIGKGNGGHAVAIVAIITLGKIACDLVRNKADGVELLTLTGCLAIAAMVTAIGLLGMFWVRKGYHAENSEEYESETTEPGIIWAQKKGGAKVMIQDSEGMREIVIL